MRRLLLLLLTVTGTAAFAAALRAESPEVLARYARTVTAAELDAWQRFRGQDSAGRELDLRELILVRSMAAEALRLGLDRRLEARLELEGKEGSLAIAALRQDLASSIEISDAQAEAKYQSFKDTFTLPRRVRLRNIFKRYPPAADAPARAELRDEMEAIRRRAVEGEDFAELAAALSDSQTRFRRGLVGNVRPGTLAPEIDAVAMAMRPGEISEVLSGPDGLTLLFCEKIVPEVERSPEELRQIARQRLRSQTFKRRWATLEEAWRTAAGPRYAWDAPDTGAIDPSAVVAEFPGGSLTWQELEILMAGPRALSQVPRRQLEQRIESYVIAGAALREAERRALFEAEPWAGRRVWARQEVLAARTLLHLVSQRFTPPSEAAVRREYESARESFIRPRQLELAAILLPSLAGADPRQAFREGELVVHRLETGELTFDEAARRYSRHSSAGDGGRLGWISRPALPGVYGFPVLKPVLGLDPGELSGLVRDEDDLWIWKLLAVEAERPMTWDEARTQAADRLGNATAREVEARVLREWMEGLRIELAEGSP